MPSRQCNCSDYDSSCLLCGGTGNIDEAVTYKLPASSTNITEVGLADNTNVTALTFQQLLDEYERSQWALAWALKALGGKLEIMQGTIADDEGKRFRVYYSQDITFTHTIELKEYTA